jgi:hypothetical protein
MTTFQRAQWKRRTAFPPSIFRSSVVCWAGSSDLRCRLKFQPQLWTVNHTGKV